MAGLVPQPLFTFRGHNAGVTSLVHLEPSTLYSGDEDGNIVAWNLNTLKQSGKSIKVCDSKILTLKIVQIILNNDVKSDLIVIQSRNDGVHLRTIDNFKIVTAFPSCKSLFSRGDAVTLHHCHQAVLAYPSVNESHLVTVRYLGNKAETLLSGSAQRQDADQDRRKSSVFDICIKLLDPSGHDLHLFIAYEDGCIALFGFNRNRLKTVPELNVTGLMIDNIRKFDLGITDFVSALDVVCLDCAEYFVVCGSPKKELIMFQFNPAHNTGNLVTDAVPMKKPGVSTISIRPDKQLVAVANWDSKVQLFSIKSRRLLAVLKNHSKQVSSMIFFRDNSNQSHSLLCCGSMDGTVSLIDIYN